jgi:SET domain-containing protein
VPRKGEGPARQHCTMNIFNSRWNHRWLNPKAEARLSSIQGLGVFAKEKILKNETVGVLGGLIVPTEEIEDYRKIMGQVGIQIDDAFFIVPQSRDELECFGVFNHSCTPNLGFTNSLTLIAIKDIEPEEECVFDYAFCETSFGGFTCCCKSHTCRKTITAKDWTHEEIQEKYRAYFSPYLRSKI